MVMSKLDEFKQSLSQKEIQKYTVSWVIYWLSIMGLLSLVFKPMGINYLENPHIVGSYYILSALIGLKFFFPVKSLHYFKDTKIQLALILLSLVVFIYLVIILKGLIPIGPEKRDSILQLKFYFPLFEVPITISKFADIFFQQALILSLVLFLKERTSSKRVTIGVFTAIFFVIHIPLFVIFGWSALYFIFPSLFAGIIFSTLILRDSFGLLHSFLVHELFYVLLGVGMRLL